MIPGPSAECEGKAREEKDGRKKAMPQAHIQISWAMYGLEIQLYASQLQETSDNQEFLQKVAI